MLDDLGVTQSEFGFPTTKHEINYLNANLELVDRGVINKTKLSGWMRGIAADVATSFQNVPRLQYANLSVSTSDQMIQGKYGGKKTRKDIIEICGAEESTPESYVFSLLKPLTGSVRGFKTTMKQRMKAGLEMASGIEDNSFRRLYSYMRKNIDAMIAIKMLLISGKLYKDIPREWVDYYNTHDNLYLDKYQRYIWKLKTIPLSRLLLLRQSMGYVWSTDTDFFRFLYNLQIYTIYEK